MNPAAAARNLDLLYGSPLDVVSSCLRGMITAAPGHELFAADFANIEGRGLAWLAGEEWKLQAFRDYDTGKGPDIYKLSAAKIYHCDISAVTKDQRQIGKVAELACGYQGGVGAFQMMAKTYLVKVPDALADEIKTGWRSANPKIVSYWYDVDAAAKHALANPGVTVSAGARGREVRFKVKGSFLWCLLPSGRTLCYPYARLDTAYTLKLKTGALSKRSKHRLDKEGIPEEASVQREDANCTFYMTVDGMSNKWVETDTYGGKLVENITQAICRDLLAGAIIRSEEAGYPVVLHVHDEVVAELPIGKGDLKFFEQLCAVTPPWAAGLPVTAAGWKGTRYRK